MPGAVLLRVGDIGHSLRLRRRKDGPICRRMLYCVRRGLCDADIYQQRGMCEGNWSPLDGER